jgi:hypothetical protein
MRLQQLAIAALPIVAFRLEARRPASKAAAHPTSRWTVERSTSKMDDSPTISIHTAAVEPIEGWLSKTRPVLTVRCLEHTLAV